MGHPSLLRGSVLEFEDYVDCGFYFYGVAGEKVGLVEPGFDGVEGCTLEHYVSAGDAEIFNGAIAGDGCLENYRALGSSGFGYGWIFGDVLPNEKAFHDCSRDAVRAADCCSYCGMLGLVGDYVVCGGAIAIVHAGYVEIGKSFWIEGEVGVLRNAGWCEELAALHLQLGYVDLLEVLDGLGLR